MRPIKICPSILSADFSRLGEDVSAVMDAGGDFVHVDVMDGHFVPNISFGAGVMKSIRHVTDKPFDVHLMIAPVDPYLDAFAAGGADINAVTATRDSYVPRGKQGTPVEVANVCAFVCSEQASFLNGTDVFVDGGGSGCTYGP